jgi:predicted NUDIX family phosphoesterase/thymidylate kinase
MTPGDDDLDARIGRIEARAKELLDRFPVRHTTMRISRRPFFVEFAGTPKAGKTTALDHMDRILRRNGYRVRIVSERASASPLGNKHDPLFNVWTASLTLSQIIESQDRDDHVVLIDRGIFDALCWMDWFRTVGRLTPDEHDTIAAFLSLNRIRRLTDLVFVLTVSPDTALDREMAGHLTRRTGAIMNTGTLQDLSASIDRVRSLRGVDFHCVHIDTTDGEQVGDLERMALITLDALDGFLESVLVVPRSITRRYLPASGFVSNPDIVRRFLEDVTRYGRFEKRDRAEEQPDDLQPIPIAYFVDGDRLLLFHRSDHDHTHRLHGRYMVWAGGHVRREDAGENAVGAALAREIQEELLIAADLEPEIVGLVVDDGDPRSEMHIGVVHRVRLRDRHVAGAMDRGPFVEPRGSSLTSQLVRTEDLRPFWPRIEMWSQAIVRDHLDWSP